MGSTKVRGNESVPRQKKGEPTKKLRKGKSTKKSGERKSKKRDGRKSASTGLTALPLKDEQARAVIGGTVPAAITTTTVAAGATVTEETSGSVMSPEEDHHSYEVSVNSVVTVKDCDHALQNFVYTQIWPIAKYGVDKDMLVDGGIAKRVMAFLGYHGEITPTYIGLWEVEKKKVLLHLRTKRFSNKAAIQQKAIELFKKQKMLPKAAYLEFFDNAEASTHLCDHFVPSVVGVSLFYEHCFRLSLYLVASDPDVTFAVDCFRDSYDHWEKLAKWLNMPIGPKPKTPTTWGGEGAASVRYVALLKQAKVSHARNPGFGEDYLAYKKKELVALNEKRASKKGGKKRPLPTVENTMTGVDNDFVPLGFSNVTGV